MKSKKPKKPLTIEQKINRRTFISFGTFAVLSAAAYKGWGWLKNSPKEVRTVTAGAKAPLRRALNQTELAFRRLYSNNNLVKTYPKDRAAKTVRYNSAIGLQPKSNVENWKLEVKKQSGEVMNITLDQIKSLPKTDLIFDFKCVEGWDQISHWGGVKFSDFIEHFNLGDQANLDYVGMATPDKKYYVGIDMPSAMHPQTLLAYEMNDQPLIPKHGEPLRLIIPVKYGIKNLKCIGSMVFSNQRPPDYWAEIGYDYYSGL
ncbi:molybdopterin-dependent oxidoreductase [Mucilaginibacter sp. RB4R14]|uniref:molybdopterin-dependent oxidoreductase n=1 Tax=Mucilaginibacter aurantiaciroseus TaxID=2949308 RepID=UPI00209188BB|nr:molybdopterin-dependent oxidoreductase [Mucilaginibacter aurantiaciroseus]MCO5936953.1 molybdopterin-dependent oxidoreductase [Mucilaginibacter aurantiaciroseus]